MAKINDIICACVIVLLLIIAYQYFIYSPLNTSENSICPLGGGKCEHYRVHNAHNDQKGAANLMKKITLNNTKLIEHLQKKYNPQPRTYDPSHKNVIDVIPTSEFFIEKSTFSGEEREYLIQRIIQLSENYDEERIREISPLNLSGVTAYSENKRSLVLCLRSKKADMNGNHQIHDIDTMMYVVLHELAHMMNNAWGHDLMFWKLFKFLLVNATEIGIYNPTDYSEKPMVYCGLELTYNPYFDKNL